MIIEETPVVHTTEVRESSAGWWIGAIVAIAAILAVVFMVTRNTPTQQDVNNAAEQGRLTGQLEGAQSSLSQAGSAAQSAADSAAQRANDAATRAENAVTNTANKAGQAIDRAVPPKPSAQ